MTETGRGSGSIAVKTLLKNPEIIGKAVGFKDLTKMHGDWIHQMVYGKGDYTLQAHRGSYKSSCLAVAIAMMMVIYPKRNIIFLRKTDDDVAEMMRMVAKILKSEMFQNLAFRLFGTELTLTTETTEQISTNLWTSPMGSPQLQGLGIRASITGKHAFYVITDDICNKEDRSSRAERERTKMQYDELQNIRNRGGRIINLGTPWHRHDVFCKMPNIHKYDCYTTELISPEKLREIRESMPPFLFAANYELKHIASSDAIFITAPAFTNNERLIYNGYAHIDAAFGGSDYTAFTCAQKQANGSIVMYGRLWHKDVGSVLELYIYKACLDTGMFNDVRTSAVVDWNGDDRDNAVSNELDVMCTRGITPVFISCKTCMIRTEALNELAVLRDRFGGEIARAAIVTPAPAGASARNRAAELNIRIIDLNDLAEGNIGESIRSLMK